jgi:hypothetical protein
MNAATKVGWEEPLVWEDRKLYKRVLAVYFRRFGEGAARPSIDGTTIDSDGRIVLRCVRGVLARYRVRGERIFYVS